MSEVVMRRQPSVPAWAWASAVLAFLLLAIVVWWAGDQSMPATTIRPQSPVAAVGTEPEPERSQYGSLDQPRKYVDWSGPTKDFRPPAPPERKPVKAKRVRIVVGKPAPAAKDTAEVETAQASKRRLEIPSAPRLRPASSTPDRFVYQNTLWVLSGSSVVTSEEVDLTALGAVNGHTLYTLTGEASEPSALFLETSPGSGQYQLYRPVG